MTLQTAVLEPSGTETPSESIEAGSVAGSGPGDVVPVSRGGAAVGRVLRRCAAAATVLAIVTAVLVGWVSQARATTTDRLEVLNARIDERVVAGRATAERLATVIVVARNVRSNATHADPDARATLDAAIRSAEGIVGQRVTTQEPDTVPQAEMLVQQAALMEQALALATTDLRAAVDEVRVSRDGVRPAASGPSGEQDEAGILMAVARP